jgi:hypothetical protein
MARLPFEEPRSKQTRTLQGLRELLPVGVGRGGARIQADESLPLRALAALEGWGRLLQKSATRA